MNLAVPLKPFTLFITAVKAIAKLNLGRIDKLEKKLKN